MSKLPIAISLVCLVATHARAELPMGLKCDPKVKIAGAEIGEVGKYEVQMGMKKEEHSALLNRKKVEPVDKCSFTGITPNRVLVVRYSGPEVGETEVQCIDLNNANAPVTFPKSIYTVRNSRISPWMLMPYCPDGKAKDGFPCSKLNTQSERATAYKDTVLKWKDGKEGKTKLYMIDLAFDQPYKIKVRPYGTSVPSNAKLFCALITRDGNVVIAGTAQYPATEAAPADAPEE